MRSFACILFHKPDLIFPQSIGLKNDCILDRGNQLGSFGIYRRIVEQRYECKHKVWMQSGIKLIYEKRFALVQGIEYVAGKGEKPSCAM